MEATMSELLFVLSLFVALVWVITHAVLLVVRTGAPDDARASHGDPISTYVEENYGSHFHQEPTSPGRSTRNL